jgi:crotonobetainyl-CoA:carnitine CoA-transferase CaiB-like acyl-CoA transferase
VADRPRSCALQAVTGLGPRPAEARVPMMLDGIRVLDLSRVIAGPYCATMMADLGADVVKVERPGRGDDLRAWRGSGMSATFAAINRGKRGIAVDLQQPEGSKLVFELARRADVVVENFLPGVADKLGLGYAAVNAVNPTAVYVSVTGFGQDGPHARRAGYNTIAQGMSGIMALTGMPGHPPTKVGGSVSDLAAAFIAFGVASAALAHRLRTGQGQQLDVSLLAATLALLPDPVAHYFDSGQRPTRVGNRNPYLTPAEAFRTKDGWLQVVIMNPEQYARFTRVLGDDTLAGDAKFGTNDSRVANHDEFKARVERVGARDHGLVGGAVRGRAGGSRADLRVRRSVRGPAGEAPRAGGDARAARVWDRPHARLPGESIGHARSDPASGATARRAHR